MAKNLLDARIATASVRSLRTHLIFLLSTALILYGLNNTVSNDISNYEIVWGLLVDTEFLESFFNLRYEFASLLILWTLANLFSAGTMFYLTGLSALLVKYYLFNKYLNYPIVAYALYVLAFAHILDGNQIRVALAACVIFYAIFVPPKSIFTYLFLSLVAVLFHYSGVIILFLYFVRYPIVPALVILPLGFLFDMIITSSEYFTFSLIWLSDPLGQVNLTNSFFIMQVCILLISVLKWRTLSNGQKRGALFNMVGVLMYIAFINNAQVAHRMRELSQVGIFAILFLGAPRLTSVKLVTSVCFAYIVGYNIFLIGSELLLL